MTSITPQTTGSHLGSRNPFAALLSPSNTGTSNASTSASQSNASNLSRSQTGRDSSERTAQRPSELDVPPSPPPKRVGALNSSPSSTNTTPTILREPTNISTLSNQPTGSFRPPEGPPPGMPPRLPPRQPATTTTTTNTNAVTSTDSARAPSSSAGPGSSTLDILNEELPPAYTPGPNTTAGEQSVDFGPARPFQNQQPGRPQPMPHQDPMSMLFSSSGQYRTSSRSSRRNESSITRLLGNLVIEYLSTPREEGRRAYGSPAPYGQSGPPRPSQPSQSLQPPMPHGSIRAPSPSHTGNSWSQYPGATNPARIPRSVTPTPQTQPQPLNDGKPTVRPTPGHPLLRDNKVLVYPLGFECRKCKLYPLTHGRFTCQSMT